LTKRIITLTTDFGLKDPYVAEMKAVILSICPEAIIIDVSHDIEKFNIRVAAYFLDSVAAYFPKETIHIAVVDPSVGTERRALLIQTEQGFFVGPDNGVLVLAAQKQGIKGVREITNPTLMLPAVSNTFHGRDVFAPAAAHLANGVPLTSFGPETNRTVKPGFAEVTFEKGVLAGEILHVDGFGNIVTNIDQKSLKSLNARGWVEVAFGRQKIKAKISKTYSQAKRHEPLVLLGSQGYVEIAVNQGNAAEKFRAIPSDKISLSSLS